MVVAKILLRRGFELNREKFVPDLGASMGPPIYIGGNLVANLATNLTILALQWGHRFTSVETREG